MFARAGSKSSNVSGSQLWQHHNKTNELWSAEVVGQRADYIHYNPVEAGFVSEPWHWKHSSAIVLMGLILIVDYFIHYHLLNFSSVGAACL